MSEVGMVGVRSGDGWCQKWGWFVSEVGMVGIG